MNMYIKGFEDLWLIHSESAHFSVYSGLVIAHNHAAHVLIRK